MFKLTKKILVVSLLLLSVFLALGYSSYRAYLIYQEARNKRIVFEKRKIAWAQLLEKLDNRVKNFKGITGIVIKDLDTGWKYSFNEDKLFASASLVKLPIMFSVFKAVNNGRINLNGTIKLKKSYITGGSGVLKTLPVGSLVSGNMLIEFMINNSDNTASNIFIEVLGFNYLNNCFKSFGLEDTNLSRKMMDFKYRKNGVENYTSAKDMAFMLERIYHNELINASLSKKSLELLKNQKINDRIPVKLPDGVTVAHKTGLERYVCHDVGIVFTDKGDYLICVLTKTKKGFRQAKMFIADIALETYNYYEQF